jgi:DNA-binding transcriptional LysR family regulator
MAVEASQIANLLAIAEHGSFTRAAAEKGMSQPALSNSIALLEQRLGVKVLERSRRGSTLTAFGEILVRRAEGVQSLLSDAEAEVRRHAAGISGPLRIGATPSVLASLLPKALRRLDEGGAPLDLEIVDGLDGRLVPMLRSGRIDIIVGPVDEMLGQTDDVIEAVLFEDPFWLAAGPASPFHGARILSLTELADAPWALPREGSSYRRHVEALFMTAGVGWPRDCILVNALPLLESLVAHTTRITLVSRAQLTQPPRPFRVIPLDGAGARRIGYKLRRAGRPGPLTQQFIEALEASACEV